MNNLIMFAAALAQVPSSDAGSFLGEGGLTKDGCYYIEDDGNPSSPVHVCIGNFQDELIIRRYLERESAQNGLSQEEKETSQGGPFESGCFLLTLDAVEGGPKKGCFGDPQGEWLIRTHLTQRSFHNSRASIIWTVE